MNDPIDIFQTSEKPLIAKFRKIVAAHSEAAGVDVGVVVFDTMVKAAPSMNEMDATHVTQVLRKAEALSKALDLFVIFVSHTGKDVTRGILGSVRFETNSDVVVYFDKAGMTLEKSKDDGTDISRQIVTKVVTVGLDEDGDPVTTLVIDRTVTEALRSAKSAELAKRDLLSPKRREFMDALDHLEGQRAGAVPIREIMDHINLGRAGRGDDTEIKPSRASNLVTELKGLGQIAEADGGIITSGRKLVGGSARFGPVDDDDA